MKFVEFIFRNISLEGALALFVILLGIYYFSRARFVSIAIVLVFSPIVQFGKFTSGEMNALFVFFFLSFFFGVILDIRAFRFSWKKEALFLREAIIKIEATTKTMTPSSFYPQRAWIIRYIEEIPDFPRKKPLHINDIYFANEEMQELKTYKKTEKEIVALLEKYKECLERNEAVGETEVRKEIKRKIEEEFKEKFCITKELLESIIEEKQPFLIRHL